MLLFCIHLVSSRAESQIKSVETTVAKRDVNVWYEARIAPSRPSEKGKKVYVYITPRVSW